MHYDEKEYYLEPDGNNDKISIIILPPLSRSLRIAYHVVRLYLY